MSECRESTTTDDDETITLLHDEIARLEAELRTYAEARVMDDPTATWDAQHGYENIEPYRARIVELSLELTAKEQTIELLLEQTQFYEESAAVRRAEWEQLQRWVEDVEQRIGSGGADESHYREEIDAERQRAESLLRHVETERKSWETQRGSLEKEISRLRANGSQAPGAGPLAALEAENRRLREGCEQLQSAAATPPDVERLRKKLSDTLSRFDAAEVEHRIAGDEWAREKNEMAAALAVARGEVARESKRSQGQNLEKVDPVAKAAAVEADERIRAFRQHLQELDVRESAERASRGGLSARLSRLWNHKNS